MPKRKKKSISTHSNIKADVAKTAVNKLSSNSKINFQKIIHTTFFSLAVILIIWMILPAIIANTPLITGPIERNLSKKFNAKVNVEKVRISNWTLRPKVRISTIDFYEKDTNLFLAFVDNVNMQLSPLSLLTGEINTEKITISRVDVELPSLIIQRYLLANKYISKTILDESMNKIDRFMSFVDGVISIDKSNGWDVVSVDSKCEFPFMSEAGISFRYAIDSENDIIKIQKFHASGIRSIERLDFTRGNSSRYTLDLPIDIDFEGTIKDKVINISPIKLTLEMCIINAAYTKNSSGTFFYVTAKDQNFNRIERLFKTRTKNNKLTDVSFQLNSHASSTRKEMLTDCSVQVRKGIFRNVPFENFSTKVNLLNDRINSFNCNVDTWNGKFHLDLLNKTDTRDSTNNTLTGHISAGRVDLNACLSEMSRIPARTGGEFNFNIDFDVENIGIANFIHSKLLQLDFTHGTGDICLSNAYLKYFATENWGATHEVPKIVRRFLNLIANMTGAPLSLPILNKLIKQLEINKPRTVFAKIQINNGNLTSPEIKAETTVGTLFANGTCTDTGELNYHLRIDLNEDVIEKYGSHPLLSIFLKDNTVELPVILVGTLDQPDVQLNMTLEQQELFEEKLTDIVTEYVENNLLKKEEKVELTDDNLKSIKKTVKSLIKRFL